MKPSKETIALSIMVQSYKMDPYVDFKNEIIGLKQEIKVLRRILKLTTHPQ